MRKLAIHLGAMLLGATLATGQAPRVVVPTGGRTLDPVRPVPAASRVLYPWKTFVTCTVFWIGETPTPRNPTPNDKSSWDVNWASNFGGFDNPEPSARIANHSSGDFRPKAFVPRLNPFYIALPYNDLIGYRTYKSEARRVIPWFHRAGVEHGKSVCKGRWVQIYRNGRSCYAQWEDCGPWVTDDWEFVFGNKRPKTRENGAAGIDLSPSIRDYMGLKSGDKVHWRFVEAAQVPYGPWKKYGNQPVSSAFSSAPGQPAADDIEARRRYLEYLRKLRDEDFRKKPLPQ